MKMFIVVVLLLSSYTLIYTGLGHWFNFSFYTGGTNS